MHKFINQVISAAILSFVLLTQASQAQVITYLRDPDLWQKVELLIHKYHPRTFSNVGKICSRSGQEFESYGRRDDGRLFVVCGSLEIVERQGSEFLSGPLVAGLLESMASTRREAEKQRIDEWDEAVKKAHPFFISAAPTEGDTTLSDRVTKRFSDPKIFHSLMSGAFETFEEGGTGRSIADEVVDRAAYSYFRAVKLTDDEKSQLAVRISNFNDQLEFLIRLRNGQAEKNRLGKTLLAKHLVQNLDLAPDSLDMVRHLLVDYDVSEPDRHQHLDTRWTLNNFGVNANPKRGFLKDVFEALSLDQKKTGRKEFRILEIGGAVGVQTVEMLKMGLTVYFNEMDSRNTVAAVRGITRLQNPELTRRLHVNVDKFPGVNLEKDHFDAAIMSLVAHFMEDEELSSSLKALCHATKPAHKAYLFAMSSLEADGWSLGPKPPHRRTKEEYEEFAKKAGWEVIKSEYEEIDEPSWEEGYPKTRMVKTGMVGLILRKKPKTD